MINGNSDPNLCSGSGEYISDYSGFVLVRFLLCCLLKRTMSLLLLEHSSQMYLRLVISLFEAQEMSGCQKKRLNIYIAVQKGHGIVHRDKDNPSVINCLI